MLILGFNLGVRMTGVSICRRIKIGYVGWKWIHLVYCAVFDGTPQQDFAQSGGYFWRSHFRKVPQKSSYVDWQTMVTNWR